jgi:curli production assembly/transport component CsgF
MMRTALVLAALTGFALTGAAQASQLIYRPVNPSFGGDPNNGSWLLSSANAQSGAGSGSGAGFTIDFPNFGDVTQPTTPTNPTTLPTNNNTTNTTNN